jgi:hypothetical protein
MTLNPMCENVETVSLLPPTFESLTLRGIPPRQVYNMTFCKVVPGGDDPEPRVQKNVKTAQCAHLTVTLHP